MKITKIEKSFRIWRIVFQFLWYSKNWHWGRFGGGWNWAFGFRAKRRIVEFYFFIFTIRISFRDKLREEIEEIEIEKKEITKRINTLESKIDLLTEILEKEKEV